MYDASNRKDIRAAEKAAKLSELNRVNFLVAAMSTAQGREWFYDLLEFCHIFNDPFSGQALLEAYRKGERNVGLRLFSDILTHCPDSYAQMIREENGRRTERAVRDSRRNDPAARGDPDSADAERSDSPDSGWDVEGREPEPDVLFDADR